MVNLVKVTSAMDLATRLKQTGSRIPKDTVLRESELFRLALPRHARLTSYFSGCQGTRPRHRGHFHRHVSQGPHLDDAHQHSLQVQCLLAQPML